MKIRHTNSKDDDVKEDMQCVTLCNTDHVTTCAVTTILLCMKTSSLTVTEFNDEVTALVPLGGDYKISYSLQHLNK